MYIILAVLDPVGEDSHATVGLKHLDNNDLAWIGQVDLVTVTDNLCNHADDSHTVKRLIETGLKGYAVIDGALGAGKVLLD